MSAPAPGVFAFSRAEAQAWTGGTWIGDAGGVAIRGAAVDSRLVRRGSLFACLPGDHHDGHVFAGRAVAAGAVLVLASRPVPVTAPVLLVPDVGRALGRLAAARRARYAGARWIAITGSNGKTTTKELVAAACAAHGATAATPGNRNNHLGVPLTLLDLPDGLAYVVIEMGANHAGEIAQLAALVRPDVGVITSIGPAHLEGFGDLLGVANAKGELFAALPPGAPALAGVHGLAAVAVAHGGDGDAILAALRARAAGRDLRLVGDGALPGTVEADSVDLRLVDGSARLALVGAHNLANAALAHAAAVAAGVPPVLALAGLATVSPVAGRLRSISAGAHVVLDDSYNANPASMLAGLRVLAARPGRRLAVLGGMGELGDHAEAGHRLVGTEAARLALPLLTVGDRALGLAAAYRAAAGPDHRHADDHERAIAAAVACCAAGPTTLLIKASRGAQLERVVAGVVAALTLASPASPGSPRGVPHCPVS